MTERHVIAANYHNAHPSMPKLAGEEVAKLFEILDDRFRSWTGRSLAEYAAEPAEPIAAAKNAP